VNVRERKYKTTSICLAVGLLTLLFSTSFSVTGYSGQFEDALAAYGRGDYLTALRLLKPLAAQGHAEAQYNLGGMYAEGRGVPQDYGEATKWFRKAAEQGHVEAQYNLGGMYFRGQGVPRDFVLAHMWFNLSVSRVPLPDRRGATIGTGVEAEKGGEVGGRQGSGVQRDAKPTTVRFANGLGNREAQI
jgi:hypothetical protein